MNERTSKCHTLLEKVRFPCERASRGDAGGWTDIICWLTHSLSSSSPVATSIKGLKSQSSSQVCKVEAVAQLS